MSLPLKGPPEGLAAERNLFKWPRGADEPVRTGHPEQSSRRELGILLSEG